MRAHSRRILTTVAIAVGLSACDDDPVQVVDTLSEAEASALASVLLDISLEGTLDAVGDTEPPAGPPSAPIAFETDVSFTAPCPLGGTVAATAALEGVVDAETEEWDVTLDVTETHQACVVSDADSGQTFTIDGAPDLNVAFDLEYTPDDFTVTGAYGGAVGWQTEGRSGTCTVDLGFDASGDPGTGAGTASLTGTVCGVTISHTITN
jgi:hypothetical protein